EAHMVDVAGPLRNSRLIEAKEARPRGNETQELVTVRLHEEAQVALARAIFFLPHVEVVVDVAPHRVDEWSQMKARLIAKMQRGRRRPLQFPNLVVRGI